MNQLKTIIESAKQKNLSFYFGGHSKPNFLFKGLIGVETKKGLVYWYEYTEDGYLNYHHTYNCNNGKTIKKYAIGYKFLHKLLNN